MSLSDMKWEKLLQQGIDEGSFPGAVAMVAESHETIWQGVAGHRMVQPETRPMYLDTVFDLASLTKVVATTTVTMHALERGILSLDTEVSDVLADFGRRGITIRHLMTHTSGLPAWKALYIDPGERCEIIPHLGQLELAYPTGTQVVYSCLGYILLGIILETVMRKPLDELTHEILAKPLGLQRTLYNPPAEWADLCAATEDSNSFEMRQVNYQRYDWRGGIILGEVHDENAHFLGGVSGNAGLFSTAGELVRFAQMLLRGGESILRSGTIAQMAELGTRSLDDRRSLGWGIVGDGVLSHTGFTGTAMRIDLQRGYAAILLTNRVHPDASCEGIGDFRIRFFGEVANCFGA